MIEPLPKTLDTTAPPAADGPAAVGTGAADSPASVGTRLYSGADPLRVPGVGSKRTHPIRGNHSSGQAWASAARTV